MTIAVLSWGADETLNNSLASYAYHGLDVGEQKIVLLQEGTRYQEDICRRWDFTPVSTTYNVGIAQGYQLLLQAADEEFFLFLENDWELIEKPYHAIMFGEHLIRTGKADLIRYRHRERPGAPLWTKQFEGREYDRPTHLLDSIHWTDPSKFPEIDIEYLDYIHVPDIDVLSTEGPFPVPARKTMEWFITTARNANWTNNPHMAKTHFLRTHILPRLQHDNLEQSMQSWWEQQSFKVAQSDGLFTHNRLD